MYRCRVDETSDERRPTEVKISRADKGLVFEGHCWDLFRSGSSLRGKSDSMQVERVLAAFQSWENKAERNAAEQPSGNANDEVVENGSEVAGYQPRVSPTPSAFPNVTQVRSNSPTGILQHETQIRKRPPVSLVADKYMILDELEGTSLNMCVNIHTKEDFVCKVSKFLNLFQKWPFLYKYIFSVSI